MRNQTTNKCIRCSSTQFFTHILLHTFATQLKCLHYCLTNEWCSEHFLGYTPKVVPCSQSDVVGCACLQSLHIHHISHSSDIASSEGRALCADLGSEHKGGVTGVFQEHSNTSTAPSGGLIRSHHHWLHGNVGRDCRGRGKGRGGSGGMGVGSHAGQSHTYHHTLLQSPTHRVQTPCQ